MLEIEVKIRIGDPQPVHEKILALGAAVLRPRHLEVNTLFDDTGGRLKSRRSAIRLRTEGKKATLTFKGPPQSSRSFKIREEFETGVKSPSQLMKILKALGYQASFSYRKYRTSFKKPRVTICLDETPVGNFIELEGERHEIVKLARALGYARKDFIKSSYVEMIEASPKKEKESAAEKPDS